MSEIWKNVVDGAADGPLIGQSQSLAEMVAEECLVDVCRKATVRHYSKGEVLFAEGARSDELALIERGDVKLTMTTMAGTTSLLELRGPGHLVGEHPALSGDPHDVTVQAVNSVSVRVIKRSELEVALVDDPQLMLGFVAYFGQQVLEARRYRFVDHNSDCFGRLCLRLLELAGRHGSAAASGIVVDSPISQEEIAQWIGVSRDGVVRAFGQGRRLGWIQTFRGGFILEDPDALRLRSAC